MFASQHLCNLLINWGLSFCGGSYESKNRKHWSVLYIEALFSDGGVWETDISTDSVLSVPMLQISL